jgi:tetratricopeptide (TPR) repeat protein
MNIATDLPTLEQRALELMQAQDFGDEAIRVNAAILERDPKRTAAWTRLGRCHMEHRQFDEAMDALRAALVLNPSNGVATNLLNDVRKRRALAPTAAERAATGFTTREFSALASLAPTDAHEALKPRIDALLESLNQSSVATKIVEARQRAGETTSRLFHANSAHADTGCVYVFHHGGRWEPQFNIGWFANPPGWTVNAVRAGIGFNSSAAGRDPDRAAAQERVVRYFERFQRVLAKSWKNELARWMSVNAGFIQYGEKPAALDLLPERAVERLLTCQNAAAVEWIFVGRWLFLDKADDAAILRDRAKLAQTIDDTFRALLPIWLSVYSSAD